VSDLRAARIQVVARAMYAADGWIHWEDDRSVLRGQHYERIAEAALDALDAYDESDEGLRAAIDEVKDLVAGLPSPPRTEDG
jgi:hypothetical protein